MEKVIDLLLLEGTPEGPKWASIKNWPGRAIFSPVESAKRILKRDEFLRPGVYILKSPPQKKSYNERIYIGESDRLGKRIKSHISQISKKPFESFVAFTSTDSILDKATVKYLEHRLIKIAQQNKTSEISNRVSPKAPYISESNLYSMDAFLREMKILLPLMGFDFLSPTVLEKPMDVSGNLEPSTGIQSGISEIHHLYRIKDSHIEAFMYVSGGRFVVTKGSQMKKTESKSIGTGRIRHRRRMVEAKLVVEEKAYYRFVEDVNFKSTSAASSVLLGRQSAGPRMWIHTETGKTYGQRLAEDLEV